MDEEESLLSLETAINQIIKYREQLLIRGRRNVEFSKTFPSGGALSAEVLNLAKDLRDYSIKLVEKIIQWTLMITPLSADAPIPYMWDGEEYLVKMMHDVDFMAIELPLDIAQRGEYIIGDPFFVNRKGNNRTTRRCALAAHLVVMDAVSRYDHSNPIISKRESLFTERKLKEAADMKLKGAGAMPRSRRMGVSDVYQNPQSRPSTREAMDGSQTSISFKGRKMYQRGKLIGEGAYAKVYDCERQDGERFAVKVYHALKGDEDQDTILYAKRCQAREIEYLKLLRHPNIIGIEETCFKDELIYVVLEKMTCNLLQLQMDRHNKVIIAGFSLLEFYALTVCQQIASALTFMHDKKVVHRDIKPENILVTKTAMSISAKICDFGSATRINPTKLQKVDRSGEKDLSHYLGSRCPEMLGNGILYGTAVDIWSMGCVVAEFITGRPLFEGHNESEVLSSIFSYFPDHDIPVEVERNLQERKMKANLEIPKKSLHAVLSSISSSFRKVIECCLVIHPHNRYSARAILRDLGELMEERRNINPPSDSLSSGDCI